jgi:hypothetical protein
MNYESEKIRIIGEVQRSRLDTPQLVAGRVHLPVAFFVGASLRLM